MLNKIIDFMQLERAREEKIKNLGIADLDSINRFKVVDEYNYKDTDCYALKDEDLDTLNGLILSFARDSSNYDGNIYINDTTIAYLAAITLKRELEKQFGNSKEVDDYCLDKMIEWQDLIFNAIDEYED